MLLKCITSFYALNENGNKNKKISIGSYWLYVGVEAKHHKLQRLYKNNKLGNYAYLTRNQVKSNFKLVETKNLEEE